MTETAGNPGNGMPTGWNQKNPAVRRILADIRELARDPSDQYAARPVEDNMFEWHFVIRGPKGTDFEGGRYHGKILLPAEYPFKPPHIVFLTPNGRWETRTKICLSMSAYHPEDWQPAWGIRTMLEALISFMPSPSDGALGAMDSSPEDRKRLAVESQSYSHPLMPVLPDEGSCTNTRTKELSEAISQMKMAASKDQERESTPSAESTNSATPEPSAANPAMPAAAEDILPPVVEPARAQQEVVANVEVMSGSGPDVAPDRVDDALRVTSWILLFAIFVLTYRKLLLTFAPEL